MNPLVKPDSDPKRLTITVPEMRGNLAGHEIGHEVKKTIRQPPDHSIIPRPCHIASEKSYE